MVENDHDFEMSKLNSEKLHANLHTIELVVLKEIVSETRSVFTLIFYNLYGGALYIFEKE